MQPGSNQGATVIQVAKNPATHTIIQQNGQHVLVGKLGRKSNFSFKQILGGSTAAVNSNAVNTDATALVADSVGNTGGTQPVQTLFPAQYIEAASEQTVYANTSNAGSGGQV